MHKSNGHMLSFDGFTLDLIRGFLINLSGEEVRLRPKSFAVLKYFVENSRRLVSKDELIAVVWGQSAVTDDSLVQCLIEVRRALNDTGQRIIRTVHGRGYIFEAEVVNHAVTPQKIDLSVPSLLPHENQPAPTVAVAAPRVAFGNAMRNWSASHRTLVWTASSLIVLLIGVAFVVSKSFNQREIAGSNVTGHASNIRAIAVLPFQDLSADPSGDYFADGMTETLIGNLAQIGSLRVISRTSAMRYKSSDKSLPQIADELKVDSVLEGSVQHSSGRVLVSVKLIRASTDSPSWTASYERALSDVLKLQNDVARDVAEAIRIQITADERARLTSAQSVNPEAYQAYLLGRYHLNRGDEESWERSRKYFERAIHLAPDYASAYAGLADTWLQRGTSVAHFKEAETPARTAALRAISLDAGLAEAHLSVANIKLLYDWDWSGAEQELVRAIQLDAGNLDAHIAYGHLLMHIGRHDEAIRQGEISVHRDPLSSKTQSALGWYLSRARRYEEASSYLKRAVELEPRNVLANFRLGIIYTQLQDFDQAIAAFEKVGTLLRAQDLRNSGIAYVYALTGKEREAQQMIQTVKSNPYGAAAVYVTLGNKQEAFKILEKAVAERRLLVALKSDPAFEALHSDTRWKELLTRMNFPNQ